MEYSIRALSELAGVSARTLRYYDEIGLLKPLYVNEAGYRYYGEQEAALLQQILFYRERGFDLKKIRQILYEKDFDLMAALEEHLLVLQEKREYMDSLIATLSHTIQAMKGEYIMSNKEKFQAFKEHAVKQNEEVYGKEIREKYGDEEIDASNQKLLHMSEAEWNQFQELEKEIYEKVKKTVLDSISPESEAAREIVQLHKEWLKKTWRQYTPAAHKGLGAMYVADQRFQSYYDKEVTGCAVLLKASIDYWSDKI